MNNTQEKIMCETITGCSQQGKIVYYGESGEQISQNEAAIILRNNGIIEVPAAGSGNYREIFTALGFSEVEVIDLTSLAGNWTFGVLGEKGWLIAYQENRYPYHGFKYGIRDIVACETFEELCRIIQYI